MSLHKTPLTQIEEDGLRAHGLDIGTPSQLSDVFRQGVAWAQDQALKAGQGEADDYAAFEAFMEVNGAVSDPRAMQYMLWKQGRNATPASADAVSVPRNIALRMAADAAQYDHEHAVVNDNVQLWQQPNARVSLTVGDLRTVRALLAQSQGVKP